jgi:hypothetical protein
MSFYQLQVKFIMKFKCFGKLLFIHIFEVQPEE